MLKLKFFLENLGATIVSLLRILFLSKWFPKKYKQKSHNDSVILGNGPSLKELLKNNRAFLEGKDVFAVNYFTTTEEFFELKPNNYIISAPEFWINDVIDRIKNNREKFFNLLGEQVDWEMNLFIPYPANRSSDWKKTVKKNKNIKIIFFNNTVVEGFTWFTNSCYTKSLGLPRPHNILIPAIMTCINSDYTTIYLWGADHSWLRDLRVTDQNDVMIDDRYFFDKRDKKDRERVMRKLGKGQRNLHEILLKFYYSFKSYFILNDYATNKGVKVINQTPNSYIDAFPKENL